MENEPTHLRVKLGAAEIEYRGDAQFLKDEVLPKVDKILEMVESRADLQRPPPPLQLEKADEVVTPLPPGNNNLEHSTNTIATLLDAKTASDLAFAAAGHLTLVMKQERITRSEIHEEMKSATAFYKASNANNLSNALKALVKADRLRLVAEDTYAMPNKSRKELEALLAQHE
jgi:hypothetical protein